jgi:hypothetical protein
MDSHYDLTTRDGMTKASTWFDDYGWLISPVAWIIKRNLPPTSDEQRRSAEALIAAGKKNGAKTLTIDMDGKAYAKLQTPENISAKAGSNRCMKVTVTYK